MKRPCAAAARKSPTMMGLPRSSLTVCFSLFSVMVLSEIFRVPPKEIFMPFAPMVVTVRSEPGVVARKKIVEGAVGMVEMALEQLSQDEVVQLDDERKAAMVSNLLVVLCGNKDAQPIVNSGSIY